MIQKFTRYFDIMATFLRNILNDGSYSEKDFQSVLNGHNSATLEQLTERFPELVNINKTPNSLGLRDINKNFFEKLSMLENENIYFQLLALYYMDRAIESCYFHNSNFEDDVEQTKSLNSNVKKTQIVIMKKTKCCWEHTVHSGNLIDLIFSVFYYIDYQKLPNTRVIHHIVDPNLIAPKSTDNYKFAISPVTKQEVLCLSTAYKRKNKKTGSFQTLFRVEKLKDEKRLKDYILENIIAAGNQNADLIVFPEMLGSDAMLQQILEEIKEKKCIVPTLIVFPSIWKKAETDEKNTNRSCMILNGQEILFEQKKYCNFKYYEENAPTIPVYEDINDTPGDRELHLLHIKGLGRICIIICYDYLESENREEIIKNLRPTLVCSPSFSTGSFEFSLLAQSGLYHNCNWIWCNTCSAYNHTKKIQNFEVAGIITTLSKNCDFARNTGLQKNYDGVASCGKKHCDKCIYYAEIPINDFKL